MYLGEAYETVMGLRSEFREVLEKNQNELEGFITKACSVCYGGFDEQVVGENLREEYLDFLREKAA